MRAVPALPTFYPNLLESLIHSSRPDTDISISREGENLEAEVTALENNLIENKRRKNLITYA